MKYFKTNPNYLRNYFYWQLLIALSLIIIGYNFTMDIMLSFNLKIALLIISPILGLVLATAFHNASHYNIKPRWLNILIGELIGFYILDGMRPFRIGHIAHHSHPDDPILDPHPPMGQSYLQFILNSKNKTIEVLKEIYYVAHGRTKISEKKLNHQMFIYRLGFILKIVAIFSILGSELFVFFYLPSFAAYFFGFAHLNWGSHYMDENGKTNILNKDGGFFYTTMNFITSGGYYHKNHHLYPKRYNPKKE